MTRAEKIERLEKRIEYINDALDSAVDNAGLVSYTYTDADGTQSTTRRNPKELAELLDITEKQIERLKRQPGGIMTHGTNRYA